MLGLVKATDFYRMVYNSLLYVNKASAAGGWTMWSLGLESLRVTSTDDYVILTDQCHVNQFESSDIQYVAPQDLKALEKELRVSEAEYFDLSNFLGEAEGNDILSEADSMVFEADAAEGMQQVSTFAVSPDRLRKLSLIKPGGYPIDIRAFGSEGRQILGFRIGPTVRGLIAPLDREHLKEMYQGEELWT